MHLLKHAAASYTARKLSAEERLRFERNAELENIVNLCRTILTQNKLDSSGLIAQTNWGDPEMELLTPERGNHLLVMNCLEDVFRRSGANIEIEHGEKGYFTGPGIYDKKTTAFLAKEVSKNALHPERIPSLSKEKELGGFTAARSTKKNSCCNCSRYEM
ncbi:MAG: hypothetical protein PHW76_00720 [Alphaproteobacteria bacterium]|nr:hypothetical protein [Alphaproteobacteria bacterium]